MIKDCPKCKRKKVIMGMGAMLKTCPECKGVGHVKVDNVEAKVDNQQPESCEPRIKRTYNRKKVNDEREEA